MTRAELIVEFYEQERRRLLTLRDGTSYKPKAGHKEQWKDCHEKLDLLKQMIGEISKDEISKNEKTGYTQQDYIGTFSDSPALYYSCRYNFIPDYYVNMSIMNSGNEGHYDERLLRLAYNIWERWFKQGKNGKNSKYECEKEKRAETNYIRATVIDGTVTKLKWSNQKKKN